MTASGKTNLPASVLARLLNQARERGDDYQILLTSYCFERFLFRLGESELRDRFVLKGATLLRIWSDEPYRATRDLDLLWTGDGSVATILDEIRAICARDVPSDGVDFDGASIRTEEIRAEDEYLGTRVLLLARIGTAKLPLQIDIGFGDALWPSPTVQRYPTLLDFAPAVILTYPREAVVAEKLEAVIVLGDRNSRIKDFFDLHYLATNFEFDRATLGEAVRRTFARRGTPIPEVAPIGLTPAYWENPSRPPQVRAFARRAGLTPPEDPDVEIGTLLREFLLPVLQNLLNESAEDRTWPPGGPWHE